MKTILRSTYLAFTIFLLTFAPIVVKAQYVNIPDGAFYNWLQNNGYASCLSGTQLDTTCPAVLAAQGINCSGQAISNLTGIEYFDNLQILLCDDNSFNTPPVFPPNLKKVTFARSVYFFVPITLPQSLQYLDCSMSQLVGINNLPNSLTYLDCSRTMLDSLPPVPDSVTYLNCTSTGISKLQFSENSMCKKLECTGLGNGVHSEINRFPPALEELYCFTAGIDSFPVFPNTLKTILCGGNPIHQLPTLPDSLDYLNCDLHYLQTLPPCFVDTILSRNYLL